jgi:hypothetical protein
MQASRVTYSIVAFAGIILIVLLGIGIYFATMQAQPSATNLAALVKAGTTSAADYPSVMTSRKSLSDYLLNKLGNTAADQLSLSNFYVMTANLGGFFSPVNTAAFCTEAVQYAIQAGARCIIFDIWPDITKGADLAPILKVCASDTDYTKLSYYTLSLQTALQTVKQEAFGNSANPGFQDPFYIFFRFRGSPSKDTFTGTANAIDLSGLGAYRIDSSSYNDTNNNPLSSRPITEFRNKLIILSDRNGIVEGVLTKFADYVNNPTPPPTPFERKSIAKPNEVNALSKDEYIALQSSLATGSILACAPLPENIETSDSNSWNWKIPMEGGIQLIAMNLWAKDDNLKAYLDNSVFGTYSFLIKSGRISTTEPFTSGPEPTPRAKTGRGAELGEDAATESLEEYFAPRFTIERIPPPIPVANLGYGTGAISPR